jgi:hypothetical protein
VWSISEAVGIDPDAVVGKLLRVWSWFDDHSEKGNAPSVTKALLDRKVGVTGFCDAMISAGWMDDDGSLISVPNFDRHNGATAKTRCLTAKRVSNHKKGNASGNAKGNAASVTSALPRAEESRAEEKKEKVEKESGGVGEKILMRFPVKGGSEWELTQAVASELRERFPKRDRKSEYQKALDWLESDKKNLKTAQGMKRFLANWLERAEDVAPVERMRSGYELKAETERAMEMRRRKYEAEAAAKEGAA